MSDHQELIFTNDVDAALARIIADADTRGGLFVVADETTARLVLPSLPSLADARLITIAAGDENKTVEALAAVWQALSDARATRHALVVNLGGGMVTDLGGFAASTFKRGVPFVNVPTTLLGAVDAAVGGKTGVNLGNLKNEVGVFNEARSVIISTCFFSTLPREELLSGYGEMLKHGLLRSAGEWRRLLAHDILGDDPEALLGLLEESVMVKRDVVLQDPTEQGIRRALNLGHTAGHAFETLAMNRRRPIPHGYAVAFGLLVSLILSHMLLGFPSDEIQRLAAYLKANYGTYPLDCRDYAELFALMSHDKKNVSPDRLAFTLLRAPGDVAIDQSVTPDDLTAALDIFRDLL